MKPLSDAQIALVTSRARALGEPTRVRLLERLARGEQTVGQLSTATEVPQPTVSKHLQVLFHAGLVERRRDASVVYYRLTEESLLPCLRFLARARLSGRR